MTLLQRLLMIALGVGMPAAAQAVRLGPVVHPFGVVVGGATVSASPGSVSFTLTAGGSATASSPITVSTTIAAVGVLDTVQIVAYFASSNALSTTSGDNIPASSVYARCSTCASTAWGSFTQSTSLGGSNSFVMENSTDLLSLFGGTRNDTLQLKIDLSGLPQAAAGTYTGTLVLAAQMF